MKNISLWLCGLLAITVIECKDIRVLSWGKETAVCRICVDGYEYVTVHTASENPTIVQSWVTLPVNGPKRCK